jgi:hypothetical protein
MKSPKNLVCLFVAVAGVLAVGTPSAGQNAVPLLVNYQGQLRSPTTGEPVADGLYEMRFRIYDAESAGNLLWTGSHSSLNGNPVEVENGLFHVILGSGEGNALDTSIFNGAERWLEIRVGMETLTPRQRITSAAFSIVSENSRLLGGKQASEFAGATHSHLGSDIASGTVAEARIDPLITRDSEKDASIGAHAAVADAHHARYTDAEARAAMGTKSDTNPLNHDKTKSFSDLTDVASDAQIPAAIARDAEVTSAISTHTAVANAHHAKTTSFTELTDVASDAQIPGAIARDAEVTSAISAHTGVADAHHARYTDAEAVAAMGAKADANPLNHDKTTSLPWGSITAIPAGFADGVDNDSGGDITGVTAGDGLSGGAVSGNATLSASFAGTGSATTVSRSDHNHDAAYVNEGQADSVTTGMIADGTIADADVNAAAAVAGTKIAPNFGSQDVVTTGKLGVGTTSPATKLHVSGGAVSVYKDDGVTNGEHELARFERDELTGYPGIRLGYRANGASVTGAFLREGGVGGDLEFGTGGFNQAMMIKNSGNVGIGTTSPNAKLEVVSSPGQDSVQLNQGEVRTDNVAASTSRYVVSIGGTGYWGLGKTNTGNNNFHIINYPSSRWDLTVRNDTGNVGVGTTSPQEKLDVNGNARVAGDLTVVGTATLGGVTMGKIYLTTSGTILSTDGGTRVLSWDAANSEIELTNTSGDWLDYWWQAQKGITTSGDATSLGTGNSNVAIISGIGTTNCYGCEVHFGQADGEEGWCSVWLQYANSRLVGHYIKY